MENLQNESNSTFFAIFDGHGTEKVAEYLSQNLHNYICANSNYSSDIKLAI